MGKVTRLPTELANQIAAGEVVERPASVVKELVENALDAGARRIGVTIELGGKRLIRVEDNGEGMLPDDARLALERHATSKLSRLDDLGTIATLGFRGEALPSIASVSHLTLRTKHRDAPHGCEIRVDGGAAGAPSDVGIPGGTVVEVADLFYNVPARRKFLKSDAAESAQISRALTQLALGYPEVGFTLVSASRRQMEYPPVSGRSERFFQIYGDRPDLVEVSKRAAGVEISGYVAALADQGPSRGPQNIFVNRRAVKDKTMAHAVREAYALASVKPRNPEVHLFVELPTDQLDVNVHPMKAEVRFLEQSLIHELVRRAIGDALGRPDSAPMPSSSSTSAGRDGVGRPASRSIPGVVEGMSAASRWAGVTDVFARPNRAASPPLVEADAVRERSASFQAPLIPLGQFRDTFIVAVDNEGIAIIDQHVAHERVLYEQVMARLTSGPLEGQRLLTPIVFELPSGQRQVLAAHEALLQRLAFEVAEFGGDSVQITTVPHLLRRGEAETAVRELAADLEGLEQGAAVDDVLKRLAATTACHSAVRANDRLTQEKMLYILQQLSQTEYSTVCPHGRPVVLRLTRHDIEKSFDRI